MSIRIGGIFYTDNDTHTEDETPAEDGPGTTHHAETDVRTGGTPRRTGYPLDKQKHRYTEETSPQDGYPHRRDI